LHSSFEINVAKLKKIIKKTRYSIVENIHLYHLNLKTTPIRAYHLL
jgi:DNA polymerase III sliding clamp (beta) subunit (PCNA family)